jgi:hypothetical protein
MHLFQRLRDVLSGVIQFRERTRQTFDADFEPRVRVQLQVTSCACIRCGDRFESLEDFRDHACRGAKD